MIFNKDFNDINYEDIKNLIDKKISESKYLDFKSNLHLSKDSEKKEFLSDIISFANAEGGYIIYGIIEENGTPIEVQGILIENLEKLFLQIEQIIRSGIEPIIKGINNEEISFKEIKINNDENKYIILIKIPKSIFSPHRVKTSGKFFRRGEKGKYEMSYEELKMAFLRNYDVLDVDKKLFKEFLKDFATNKMQNLKDISFSNFYLEEILNFEQLIYKWRQAEFSFINENLETEKIKLLNLIEELLSITSLNTFPKSTSTGKQIFGIPGEWKHQNRERYYQLIETLNNLVEMIYDAHQNFVKLGRKILKI